MKAIKVENHKMFVRITNMVDPDPTASESGSSLFVEDFLTMQHSTFLFLLSKYWLSFINTGIHKMLVRITNREDPD